MAAYLSMSKQCHSTNQWAPLNSPANVVRCAVVGLSVSSSAQSVRSVWHRLRWTCSATLYPTSLRGLATGTLLLRPSGHALCVLSSVGGAIVGNYLLCVWVVWLLFAMPLKPAVASSQWARTRQPSDYLSLDAAATTQPTEEHTYTCSAGLVVGLTRQFSADT